MTKFIQPGTVRLALDVSNQEITIRFMLYLAIFTGLGFILLAFPGSGAEPNNETRTVHLVSRIVGKEFISETIRIGDPNEDGAPDILFVQNIHGPRIITCLAVPYQGRHWHYGAGLRLNESCHLRDKCRP